MCAEPSPDGLSALAAEASGNVDAINKLTASFQGRSVETATNIGLRTPTVQSLRDAMYRACEAYASGGIDTEAYKGLLRRYQNILMGLIAIENVTGTITPQPVTIGADATAQDGEALVKAAELLAQASDDVTRLQGTIQTRQQELEKLKKSSETCARIGFALALSF